MAATKQQESWADDSSSDDESVGGNEQVQQEVERPQKAPASAPSGESNVQEDSQGYQHQGRHRDNQGHREHRDHREHQGRREHQGHGYPNKRDGDDYGPRDPYQEPKSDYVIHVGNLAYSVTDDDLGGFFHSGGCSVQDAHVYLDGNRSRGYGVVIFTDEASFQKSLAANGADLLGRNITVKPKEKRGKQDRGPYNRQGRGEGGRGEGGRGREYEGYRDRSEGNRDRDGYPKRDGPRDNRDNRDGRGRGGSRGFDSEKAPVATEKSDAPPATRPKFVLAERTLPVEKVGEFIGSNSGIFGAAKARDEHVLEEKKKDTAVAEPSAAESAPELPPTPPVVAQTPPAPPVEKPRTPKQSRSEFSDKKASGPRTDKKREEGGREGEAGKVDSWRGSGGGGRGRGDRPYTGRGRDGGRDGGGRGRGDNRKKDIVEPTTTQVPPQASEPKAKKGEPDDEQLALARFQNAQEKLLKKEQQQRAQESKRGQNQVVNTFGALQLDDDSDEEA